MQTTTPEEEGKTCRKCCSFKPFSEFYPNRSKRGLCFRCKECMKEDSKVYRSNNPEKVKKQNRLWKKNNKERARATQEAWLDQNPLYHTQHRARTRERQKDLTLKCRYGISLSQYKAMVAAQSGRCGICGKDDPGGNHQWPVDHDHNTGKVRGLLCHTCNVAIGLLGDTVPRLQSALDYLVNNPATKVLEENH